jgi:hypothetical protein
MYISFFSAQKFCLSRTAPFLGKNIFYQMASKVLCQYVCYLRKVCNNEIYIIKLINSNITLR